MSTEKRPNAAVFLLDTLRNEGRNVREADSSVGEADEAREGHKQTVAALRQALRILGFEEEAREDNGL
jgi:hypothetical protein